MTAARRIRKPTIRLAAFALALAILSGLNLAPGDAATTERVVIDRHTGLALYGFDPVAYFTDAVALAGRPDFELWLAGATWRFRNEGNRAAFADRPDVYMPRFGGYDPLAAARGVAVPGSPRYWAVAGSRLYLFESPQTRAAFASDPDKAIAGAEAHWPQVLKGLAP
jgi:hypothetical protein